MTPDPNTSQKGVQPESSASAPRLNPFLTPKAAQAVLEHLYRVFGPQPVFIRVVYGKKKAFGKEWQRHTWERTQTPQYQKRLLKWIQEGGNIGLLLGSASGGIRAIDLDRPRELERFLIQNPMLAQTVQRKSAHGGQVFVRMEKELPGFPLDQAVYDLHLEESNEKIGEWRCGGGGKGAQSVVYGWLDPVESGDKVKKLLGPPDGVRYELLGEGPLFDAAQEGQIRLPFNYQLSRNGAGAPPLGPPPEPAPEPETAAPIDDPDDDPNPNDEADQGAAREIRLDELPVEERRILDRRIHLYLGEIEPAIQGKGGSIPTYRAACALCWGFALCREDALRFLYYYSSTRSQPPWSQTELEHKVDDALKETRHQKPRGHLLGEGELERLLAIQAAAPEPEPHHKSTASPPQGEAAEAANGARSAGSQEADQGGGAWRAERFKVWVDKRPGDLASEFPPVLIPGMLYQGRRLMIAGKPFAGKGLLLLQLCFCLATGTPFLGRKLGKPKRVYHIDFELMEASLRDRLWKMCEHFAKGNPEERDRLWELINQNLAVLATLNHPELCDDPEFFAEIAARAIKKHQPVLISLDPLWQICPSELDEERLRDFLRKLRIFTRETGSSPAYSHHQTKGDQSRKAVGDRFSGRNDLTRDCATFIALTDLEDGTERLAVDVLTNDFEKPAQFHIKLAYPVFELNFEAVSARGKPIKTIADFLALIPLNGDVQGPISLAELNVAAKAAGITEDERKDWRDNLIKDRRIFAWKIPTTTRPQMGFAQNEPREDQKWGKK
jgi:AAA domain